MDKLTQAFDFRHACKLFDHSKKINRNDINYILNAGRNSPSSFGLEPWHFVVVENEKLKQALQPICYHQAQVTSCSHFIIVLYRKAKQFTLQSDYLRKTVARELSDPNDQASIDIACQAIIHFYDNELAHGLTIDHWSEMQCYLASANMLTASAYIGIDSCAIGGFESEKMMPILKTYMPTLNVDDFGVALCLALGYRLNEPGKRIRWPLADTCTFL